MKEVNNYFIILIILLTIYIFIIIFLLLCFMKLVNNYFCTQQIYQCHNPHQYENKLV